ncbi:transcription factor e(y)2-domain-containing protein [Sporodiniella umbellata]|nr:transcription factor e(y)2-domain-containing protein [Sporodiniella umbellata]
MSSPCKTELAIRQIFVESGEKERLLQMLRSQLVESGWSDSLNAYCREAVQKKENDDLTFEDLFKDSSDYGRSTIHESIKINMLEKIKKFIDEHTE